MMREEEEGGELQRINKGRVPLKTAVVVEVKIDDKSGFCFGVVNAISKAEEFVEEGGELFSLGDIVHNRVEVQRLEEMGLKPLKYEEYEKLNSGTVLIRAHGEPPKTYRRAEQQGLRLIDATCPVVAKLQELVKRAYVQMQEVGGQVVVLGKKGHAEVVGLTGQIEGDVIVVERMEDLEGVDFDRPIYLLSQTTQSLALFGEVAQEIIERARESEKVIIRDTICRQVANREPHLRGFAKKFDVIVFVSGRKSSNGRVLYEVCKQENPRTYMVEEQGELQKEWFEGARSVGVCGATSTPKWLMERVAETLRLF